MVQPADCGAVYGGQRPAAQPHAGFVHRGWPRHVRLFTDEENNFKPQIISEAIHLELDGLDMEKVYAYKEANDNDELYKYLLITQCNALNSVLPGMFQKIADYTELLFPDNLLREGSVIQQMS